MLASILALTLAAATAPPPDASAPRSASVTGRLMFREKGRLLAPRDLRRALHGARLAIGLRRGWDVLVAPVGDDGSFQASATAGVWRIEWLEVGGKSELLAPHEVDARPGQTTCAGQLELAMQDVETELGANAGSQLAVVDRCAGLGPGAARLPVVPGVARPGSDFEGSGSRGALEILAGLRGGWAFGEGEGDATVGGWRLELVGGLSSPLGHARNLLLVASFADVNREVSGIVGPPLAATRAIGLGGGYAPFGWLEATAGGEVRFGGRSGLVPWLALRAGNPAFGLGGRAAFGPDGRELSITVDLSPLFLVGSLL